MNIRQLYTNLMTLDPRQQGKSRVCLYSYLSPDSIVFLSISYVKERDKAGE